MLEPIPFELFRIECKRRKTLGTDALPPGTLPRITHQRTHVLESSISEVPRHEFLVRTLDDQSRCLGGDVTRC
ncbi:hypothetical protein GCM10007269_08330 [Microbacterium murale]|uniref:Uncharacterized protein n=1 Tax=Microbacterium murale TaxID=1081040 RepID=A0ABQ1REA9_9MICO|nr:hypothetical protein GCM10007269_08330 [Microbacterium murale]